MKCQPALAPAPTRTRYLQTRDNPMTIPNVTAIPIEPNDNNLGLRHVKRVSGPVSIYFSFLLHY